MKNKKILFVYGTRPEFIKMIPLIFEAKKRSQINVITCSTGQHREMLESLYLYFDFRPDFDFGLMKSNQNLVDLHAETMLKMSQIINDQKPDWMIVQGDTTTAHAAAMSAFYEQIPVAHVEAGLRTYDIQSPFPEEMNRRTIGLIARAHFCPTLDAAENLISERIDDKSCIHVTGNTGIDTLNLVAAKNESTDVYKKVIEEKFSFLRNEDFILATLHRRENFGDAQKSVLKAFLSIIKERKINIVFPVHPNPNVRASVQEVFKNEIGHSVFWVDRAQEYFPENNSGLIYLTEPMDYPSLVYAMKNCQFVLTDSGGLQEEAPSFQKKILVLRESTERPEGVRAGFSKLVGTNTDLIVGEAFKLVDLKSKWQGSIPTNPFGDGRASEKIIDALI